MLTNGICKEVTVIVEVANVPVPSEPAVIIKASFWNLLWQKWVDAMVNWKEFSIILFLSNEAEVVSWSSKQRVINIDLHKLPNEN